ncbi:MAG: hypothetical protein U0Q16_30535 [Bryobacteraceae bacterium]
MKFITLLAAAAAALFAQSKEWKTGPEVGQKVPDFELTDQFGKQQSLATLTGRKGLMLAFVRSADW